MASGSAEARSNPGCTFWPCHHVIKNMSFTISLWRDVHGSAEGICRLRRRRSGAEGDKAERTLSFFISQKQYGSPDGPEKAVQPHCLCCNEAVLLFPVLQAYSCRGTGARKGSHLPGAEHTPAGHRRAAAGCECPHCGIGWERFSTHPIRKQSCGAAFSNNKNKRFKKTTTKMLHKKTAKRVGQRPNTLQPGESVR